MFDESAMSQLAGKLSLEIFGRARAASRTGKDLGEESFDRGILNGKLLELCETAGLARRLPLENEETRGYKKRRDETKRRTVRVNVKTGREPILRPRQ